MKIALALVLLLVALGVVLLGLDAGWFGAGGPQRWTVTTHDAPAHLGGVQRLELQRVDGQLSLRWLDAAGRPRSQKGVVYLISARVLRAEGDVVWVETSEEHDSHSEENVRQWVRYRVDLRDGKVEREAAGSESYYLEK